MELILPAIKKFFQKPGLPFSQFRINVKQLKNKTVMKFVKLSIFALTMGLFIASCGNGEGNKEADTTATAPAVAPADTMATTPTPAQAMDTAKAAMDTAKAAAAEVKK